MSNHPIALQLYTVRDELAADHSGTLRAVAEMGYRAVELTGPGPEGAERLREELDRLGLTPTGMHVPLDRLERELPDAIADARALGIRYVVCPWLPPDRRGNAAGYRSLAGTLSQVGHRCRAAGLQLCYHNHDFEFQEFDGRTGLEILFDSVDGDLVRSELDVYWAAYAGHDPVEWLRRLGGRVPLVHLKDMTSGEPRTFAEVGHGALDFPAILQECDRSGADWLIVEQDRCAGPPLESARLSLEYLRSLGRA